ncbi:phenylalanine--tRNA ligase subunit alpha [Selenomonadales bacterium OttesenSCG-928-I06]|nr:phenylalanine--tRNA ligase subunit alpha [Selenomonadales bacterium OttesenSCG-928-I06]
MNKLKEELNLFRNEGLTELNNASSEKELNDLKVKYLGKKSNLTTFLRSLGSLSPEERPLVGKLVNEVRADFENIIAEKSSTLKEKELSGKLSSEKIDVTLPGRRNDIGHKHPLTLTLERVKNSFINMGFSVAEGPEIESDFHNFEALNLPKDHPARDMQDSFYITKEFLLRTHTSPVQVRTMQQAKPNSPIRIIAPGRVYRRDYDATHSPVFNQVEGLVIDEDINFSDLKAILEFFLKDIFGNSVKVRFRPSFFPFTEPSAEVDISCVMCNGKGCRVCSYTSWLEILGSGMVHPNVLKMSNYDPEKVSGFAFGLGIERITMLLYKINDLRLFYENDVRFLEQF